MEWLWGRREPPGFVTIISEHIAAYLDLGWNIIPAFLSSPQFLRRAISKSNLLLAVNCACCAI